MRLRPHHLLCTQGYSGKGYNSDFVRNMTAITTCLRKEINITVDIVFSTDDICEKCPKKMGVDLCQDNGKVKSFDSKIIHYFCLEEKNYVYQELIQKINVQMTESILADICASCDWYPISACKRTILGAPSLNE
ncbi:MAG TPA: DUF1284 domain-containing protein [Clostridia bacterium]|nr:DUF1284 domain-containing protein [Clostridia bacterium]